MQRWFPPETHIPSTMFRLFQGIQTPVPRLCSPYVLEKMGVMTVWTPEVHPYKIYRADFIRIVNKGGLYLPQDSISLTSLFSCPVSYIPYSASYWMQNPPLRVGFAINNPSFSLLQTPACPCILPVCPCSRTAPTVKSHHPGQTSASLPHSGRVKCSPFR